MQPILKDDLSQPKQSIFKMAKYGFWKLLIYASALLIAVIIVGVIWAAFNVRMPAGAGNPFVSPSRETTFFTKPLDENGDVDYLAAINEKFFEGVTPENNAMVKFLEVIWPSGAFYDSNDFYDLVGFKEGDKTQNPFLEFASWHKEFIAKNGQTDPAAIIPFEFAKQAPWTPEQFPEVDRWLTHYQSQVSIFSTGFSRERYFLPLMPQKHETYRPAVMDANLELVEKILHVGDYFKVRSMKCLGTGKSQQAFDNVNSLFLLSAVLAKGASSVEQASSAKLIETACQLACTISANDSTTAQQLNEFLDKSKKLKSTDQLSTSLNVLDRTMLLDAYIYTQRYGLGGPMTFFRTTADHPEGLKFINEWFDKLEQAASIEDDTKRIARFEAMIDELKELDAEIMERNTFARNAFNGRKAKGSSLGKIFLAQMAPDFSGLGKQMVGKKANIRMMQMFVASEIHRRQNETYPRTANEVANFFADRTPKDPLSSQDIELEIRDTKLVVSCQSAQELSVDLPSWDEFREERESRAGSISIEELIKAVKKQVEEQKSAKSK